ncbi:efflux RND transporter periplasmic adaptor subunit [Synechococcus sp. RedBA-s]|uniref:efflux RND transporter periplasmic adaptor subunit n=1 Tax=Synechococcus sp. RedBA-s TaxID=2823741 RepID=UPI0020CB9869|nr:efflux RND transporter periplasmic adaptor subunit [Synechococcus sp. RedBA-s]MCP9801458.1 efflux RND transporter periplasmic adaptor subunit [Synechococcus sp. RedBA-s]
MASGGGAALLGGCQPKASESPPVAASRRVSALGRVEPETKIRKVSVSSSLSGDRIEEILVQEDTWVKEGTPLARLNSYGTLKASYDEASENVAVAQSKLAQVQAGAKQGEIRAQEFNVQSLERKLAAQKLAQDQSVNSARARAAESRVERQRYDSLYASGSVSALERDRYRTRDETSRADLAKAIETREGTLLTLRSDIESAKQTLEQIKEVRPQDVTTANNELRKALAARNRSQQEFGFATVRAPQSGRILKINARPGDKVSDQGILEMADTSRMIVTAEVYQTDMRMIGIGQRATITADGIEGSLKGKVFQVIPQVQKQTIFAGEPGENQDQRVFEVKLHLQLNEAEQKRIGYASNLQVNVVFDPKTATATPAPAR